MIGRIRFDGQKKRRQPISSGVLGDCVICAAAGVYRCSLCLGPICSLACYRAEAHEACAAQLDQRTLAQELEGEQGNDAEDMELLLRKERLLERLGGRALDSMTQEELLELLDNDQQSNFYKTITSHHQATQLVEEEFTPTPPWYTTAVIPPLVSIAPLAILPKNHAQMVHNLIAILFAYAYLLRTYDLESLTQAERKEQRDHIKHLLPFLTENSTLVLPDIPAAVEYVLSRIEHPLDPPFLAVLLTDVHAMLAPSNISTLDPSSPSPYSTSLSISLLAALSDLFHLFAPPSSAKAPPATARKLLFYFSLIVHPTSMITTQGLEAMSERIGAEAEKRLEEELAREGRLQQRGKELAEKFEDLSLVPEPDRVETGTGEKSRPRIEVLD